MIMNLTKLFEMQKVLVERIAYNESDRFDKTILALIVEVGECANEWRGFKYWSKNQKPSRIIHTTAGATEENAVEFVCADDDNCGERFEKSDARLKDLFGQNNEDCPVCKNGYLYAMREQNPLLEEYVDGTHFVLQLGIELKELGVLDDLPLIHRTTIKEKTISQQFKLVIRTALNVEMNFTFNNDLTKNSYLYLLDVYIGLGEMLGFTWEEIEQAHIAKNEVNHNRQNTGY